MRGYTRAIVILFLFLLSAGCVGVQIYKPQTAPESVMFDQWGRLTATGAGTTGKPPIDPQFEYRGRRGETSE